MSSVEEVTIPKAALDELMRQISTLQSTVDKLTALLEEKNQIILNQNRARFGQSSEKRTYLLSDVHRLFLVALHIKHTINQTISVSEFELFLSLNLEMNCSE